MVWLLEWTDWLKIITSIRKGPQWPPTLEKDTACDMCACARGCVIACVGACAYIYLYICYFVYACFWGVWHLKRHFFISRRAAILFQPLPRGDGGGLTLWKRDRSSRRSLGIYRAVHLQLRWPVARPKMLSDIIILTCNLCPQSSSWFIFRSAMLDFNRIDTFSLVVVFQAEFL